MSAAASREEHYDAIVVGARCAGSSAAVRLARGGWRVALVDADRFPSDAVSTHVVFPDSLEELAELGVLARLEARHRLAPVRFSWRVLGHDVAGTFTPVGGRDRCVSVRRITLDATLVEAAQDAGAVLHAPHRVVDVIGAGTPTDPARGVVLDDGRRLRAPWVLAADGQRSTVARRLGLAATDERRGEMAFLLGYWEGLPPSDWCVIDVRESSGLMSVPVEDGLHLLSLFGTPALTRGTPAVRGTRYTDALRTFPAVLNPRLLDRATLVSGVVAVPETMLRGYRRPASGPGWATVGDAGLLKHPSTAQGIGDALQQARHVATDLLGGGDLSGFGPWRDARAEGHDDFSFRAARFPRPEAAGLYAGIAADPEARQQFLDTFLKSTRISDVVTVERTERWRAASAYEDGVRRLCALVEGLAPDQLETVVPACPAWTVRQLLAHLSGVAADAAHGRYFAGAVDAWHDARLAQQRDEWTAGHVRDRSGRDAEALLDELQRHASALVSALRTGHGPAVDVPLWMLGSPAADLAVHLDDVAEALGRDPAPDAPVARAGFALYRRWLSARITARSLPALRLTDGEHEWLAGTGPAGAAVRADRHELFRTISGRRSATEISGLSWQGAPAPYLDVLSPYPLPAAPAG